MISVAATSGLPEAISAFGADPGQIWRALKLDCSVLSDPDKFIPCSVFARMLDEGSRITGDDCFGLHFGERFNPKNIGPLAYVVLNSPTVLAAYQHAARYLKLYNQAARVSSIVEGGRAYFQYSLCDLGIAPPRQQNEYGMVVTLNTIRMMVGSRWTPLEVHFAHKAPPEISEHQRIFGAPVLFDYATNDLVVDSEILQHKVPAADQRLHSIVQRYMERMFEQVPEEDEIITALRRAIAESIKDGNTNLTRVTKKMGLGPRTLQRQLRAHQLEFKTLLDDTRRRLALSYLKDRRHTLTQIAFLLGYSEASAFNRAFKRWTGTTPIAYRCATTPPQLVGVAPLDDDSLDVTNDTPWRS